MALRKGRWATPEDSYDDDYDDEDVECECGDDPCTCGEDDDDVDLDAMQDAEDRAIDRDNARY